MGETPGHSIVWPRSGIWILRRMTDRRLNVRGQYSSTEWWDPPRCGQPPEADQALEELRASLGANPPTDLRCISIPYPTARLKRVFEARVLTATEKQGA
jgi:hypothetical protein